MIIKQDKHIVVEGDAFTTMTSKVNDKKLAKLYGLLSNIYRNPIGAIVREYTSNGYDANKEAYNFKNLSYEECCKTYSWLVDDEYPELNMTREEFLELKSNIKIATGKDPIQVGIDARQSQWYFYVQDFGIGMSPQRMQHIFFNYLDTTKEDTDGEIGGFGIGAKSALAYSKTFLITTVYNGIKYDYMMSKGSMGIPEGVLLSQSETSQDNGTLIRVPMDSSDRENFEKEIGSQLAYMFNVYYENKGNLPFAYYHHRTTSEDSFNKNKIFQGDGWRLNSHNRPHKVMHLCIENVTYTIDWTEIGIPPINLPVALVFETSELQPTPSRESVLYTDSSRKIILDRINKFCDYCVDRYNSLREDTDDLKFFLHNRYKTSTLIEDFVAEDSFSYSLDVSVITIVFPEYILKRINYKPLSFLKKIPNNIFIDYKANRRVNPVDGGSYEVSSSSELIISKDYYFAIVTGKTQNNVLRNKYILEMKTDKKEFYHMLKRKPSLARYKRELDLSLYPKSEWRDIISKYQKASDEIFENYSRSLGKYEDILINPNWHKTYSAGKSYYSPASKKKQLSGIYIKKYNYSAGLSWVPSEIKLSELDKKTVVSFYTVHDRKNDIERLWQVLSCIIPMQRMKMFTVSNTNFKKMKEMEFKNAYSIDDLQKRTPAFFRKVVTLYSIKSDIHSMSEMKRLKGICDRYYETYMSLYGKVESYLRNYHYGQIDSFMKECYEFCEQLGVLRQDYIDDLNSLKEIKEKAPLLAYVSANSQQGCKDAMVHYLKLCKIRINAEYYEKDEGRPSGDGT